MIFSEDFFHRTPLGDYFYTEAHEVKKVKRKTSISQFTEVSITMKRSKWGETTRKIVITAFHES